MSNFPWKRPFYKDPRFQNVLWIIVAVLGLAYIAFF